MKLSDVELAFEFVSAHSQYEAQAFVSRRTGKTYCRSDMSGLNELPEDIDESDDYVEVPHKNELDLGRELVFRFVEVAMPDAHDAVRDIFGRRGAYGRFKDYLEQRGKLEQWHRFEDDETRRALVDWCEGEGIELDPET